MTVVARTRYRRSGIHANRVRLAGEARARPAIGSRDVKHRAQYMGGGERRSYFIISIALSACVIQPASSFLSIVPFAMLSSFMAASFLGVPVDVVIISSTSTRSPNRL
jgi:hypothetical protein